MHGPLRRIAAAGLVAGALTLTGAAAPSIADPGFTSDPFQVVFDFAAVGSTTPPQTVTLANNGTSQTTFGPLSIRGSAAGDFLLTSDGCSGRTLPSGGGCQVQIAFRPSAPGTRVASLRVPDGTACANWVTLAGSGERTAAPPRAHAAVCSAPEKPVEVQVTPTGTLPSIQDNSIIDGPKKRCSSKRRFRIRLAPPRGTHIDTAKVLVAGKSVPTKRIKGRTTAVVDLRGKRKGTAVVDITIKATNGRTYKGKRTYRTCAGKESGGSPRY